MPLARPVTAIGEADPLVVPEMPTTLVVGATDDSLALGFDLDATGSGSGDIGAFALTANGVDLLKLAGDRGQIDTITAAQCPQVRDGALYALEIPDLASALIGF